MEALSIIGLVLVLVFYIWMIVLFVRMSSDTRVIKKVLADQGSGTEESKISMRDINLAILLHTQEKTFERLVTSLYNQFVKRCVKMEDGKLTPGIYKESELEMYIRSANKYAAMLGMNIPQQLQSMDAFLDFYNK